VDSIESPGLASFSGKGQYPLSASLRKNPVVCRYGRCARSDASEQNAPAQTPKLLSLLDSALRSVRASSTKIASTHAKGINLALEQAWCIQAATLSDKVAL